MEARLDTKVPMCCCDGDDDWLLDGDVPDGVKFLIQSRTCRSFFEASLPVYEKQVSQKKLNSGVKPTSVFDGLHKDLILRAPRLVLPNQIDQVLRRVDKFGPLGLEKRIELLCSLIRNHASIHTNS